MFFSKQFSEVHQLSGRLNLPTQYPNPSGSCLKGAEAYSTCHEIMYAEGNLKGVISHHKYRLSISKVNWNSRELCLYYSPK